MQLKNWILFVIEDNSLNPILSEFAEICIDKNVLYVCTSGKAAKQVNELFDMKMVMREIDHKPMPTWYKTEDDVLITTWHHNLDEGFWFCTSVASYKEQLIEKVIVANLSSKDYLPRIENLASRITEGWLPPD